jgi:uncharacterized lipoprotein YddW (UPF0748 family)
MGVGLSAVAAGQGYRASGEQVPMANREFRAAWVATIYNIDWPSAPGLPAATQKAQLCSLLDKLAELNVNAIFFQVRPHGDAVYASSLEPWSHWLSGTMGQSPGYDPLAYCIQQAHARGIEVHAWFNPFRALANAALPTCPSHICRVQPRLTKRFGSLVWMDPGFPETRSRTLAVMLDVVRRYDIDGLHIDDYFYPYPVAGGAKFPDGKTPAQRRAYVDEFVRTMYSSVKQAKPWVRVGISPFGIWRPGVPAGTTAGIDACEDLAADARKWIDQGWCDYLAPQLYWRIAPQKQSFTLLLEWWRQQGSRPVWPGIATQRIQSSDDPGRPASEIINQIAATRQIGRNWAGHCHWSAKSLVENRGGISTLLKRGPYAEPALVPPMPWSSTAAPKAPSVSATLRGNATIVSWAGAADVSRWAIQARYGNRWVTAKVLPGPANSITLGPVNGRPADAVAVTAANRFGNTSRPVVLAR